MNLTESIMYNLKESDSEGKYLVYLKDVEDGAIYKLLSVPMSMSIEQLQELIYSTKEAHREEIDKYGNDVEVVFNDIFEKYPEIDEVEIPNESDDYLVI